MSSSGPILTCHTKEFSTTDFTETIDISGRCVLHLLWVVIGISSPAAGTTTLLDFKSGGSGGENILQFGNPKQRVGFGSGGILFPDGIYVKPNVWNAHIGGITLLYEQG